MRFRFSDGRSWTREFEADSPRSLRVKLYELSREPDFSTDPLRLHVQSTRLEHWSWVDVERPPRMTAGVTLSRPPYVITRQEAELLWGAAVHTEKTVTEHALAIEGLAAWAAGKIAQQKKPGPRRMDSDE